jgi:hypothetical protein
MDHVSVAGSPVISRDAIVDYKRSGLLDHVGSVHADFISEISLLSDTDASPGWPMKKRS